MALFMEKEMENNTMPVWSEDIVVTDKNGEVIHRMDSTKKQLKRYRVQYTQYQDYPDDELLLIMVNDDQWQGQYSEIRQYFLTRQNKQLAPVIVGSQGRLF